MSALKWPVVVGMAVLLTPPRGTTVQSPTQQTAIFRAGTDLVVLDVSVLDRNRRPVRGLIAEDFTVTLDGIGQPVASFLAVDVPETPEATTRWMTRTPFDVQSNHVPDGRVILIYMDERTASNDPFFTKAARDIGHAIVDQLAPNDLSAVGFVIDHRGAQEFTTDRARLHQAVDTFAPTFAPPGLSIVRTLTDLCRLMTAIPDRRKAIVYIGNGEPFSTAVLSAVDRVGVQADPADSLANREQRDMFDRLMELFRVAQRANVNVYALDPAGLGVDMPADLPGADSVQPDRNKQDFLRMLSANTGGRAVTNNNAAAAEVAPILRENQSYYLLAFRQPPAVKGGFRRIDVRVKRQNVEVRARRGYVDPPATPSAGDPNFVPPQRRRFLPASDVSLMLWAEPVAIDENGVPVVALSMRALLAGARSPKSIAVTYNILDMNGGRRGGGQVAVAPGAQALGFTSLEPGRYDVHVTARTDGGVEGELFGDVTVPDFRKAPVSLSGVIMTDAPSPPPAAAAALLPMMPSVVREFERTSQPVAIARVFQAQGAALIPIAVSASVLDAREKKVFESKDTLLQDRFKAGFGEYRLNVPVSALPTGPYVLRIDAVRGSVTTRREVRFAVK